MAPPHEGLSPPRGTMDSPGLCRPHFKIKMSLGVPLGFLSPRSRSRMLLPPSRPRAHLALAEARKPLESPAVPGRRRSPPRGVPTSRPRTLTSAVRYSRMAALYTAAVAPTRPWLVVRFLRCLWIRPTGNCNENRHYSHGRLVGLAPLAAMLNVTYPLISQINQLTAMQGVHALCFCSQRHKISGKNR